MKFCTRINTYLYVKVVLVKAVDQSLSVYVRGISQDRSECEQQQEKDCKANVRLEKGVEESLFFFFFLFLVDFLNIHFLCDLVGMSDYIQKGSPGVLFLSRIRVTVLCTH